MKAAFVANPSAPSAGVNLGVSGSGLDLRTDQDLAPGFSHELLNRRAEAGSDFVVVSARPCEQRYDEEVDHDHHHDNRNRKVDPHVDEYLRSRGLRTFSRAAGRSPCSLETSETSVLPYGYARALHTLRLFACPTDRT